MKPRQLQWVVIFVMLLLFRASATVLYVDLNSTNSTPPYADWNTAATNIQDAVDASTDGDQILVTNGVYQVGSRVAPDGSITRVVVTNTVTLQSVNGSAVTLIDGGNSMHCVYLANDATLIGFTVTNGNSVFGGGVWCDSTSIIVTNCILVGNSAGWGGGAFQGTMNNCVFIGNSSSGGGAANSSTFNNCMLTNNSNGASFSTFNNCVLVSNYEAVYYCVLTNCILKNNPGYEPCSFSGTLVNCLLTGNGGYAVSGGDFLINCTIVDNTNGIYDGMANNCIIYGNDTQGGANYVNAGEIGTLVLNYCCTTPDPAGVNGSMDNIINEPLFVNEAVGDFHLQSNSPCINLGDNASVNNATDLDNQPRIFGGIVDIGAYEFQSPIPLNVGIQAGATTAVAGFALNFTGLISRGITTAVIWNFGDGTEVSNQLSVSHIWAAPGDYPVVLTAYGDSNLGGTSAPVMVHVVAQSIHYVSLDSTNPIPPYLSWDTAATNIEDAVDAALIGGTVLVSNGVYQTGGRVVYGSLTNRVAVTKPLTIQSINGPTVTVIQGYQDTNTIVGDDAVRCVYLTNSTALVGFTLTGGATRNDGDWDQEQCGGGVWCASASVVVSNCVIGGNSAAGAGGGGYGGTLRGCILITNSATSGGGAFGGVLNDCILNANSASNGGGACSNALNNCTLTGNSAYVGGAADACTANNCILSDNGPSPLGWGEGVGGGANNCILNYCQITNNSVGWGAGGGINASIANNCLLWNNSAPGGSGAESSTLNNCTLVANQASGSEGWYGGGAADACTMYNCILYYNDGVNGNYNNCNLYYCCTTPLPTVGMGNIADEPLFVDLINSDFHLQFNSPCINMGNNAYVTNNTDFDGNPRIVGGTVDIGAYEFQTVIPMRAAIQVDFTNAVAGFVLHFIGSTLDGPATTSQWDFGDGTVVSNQLSVSYSWDAAGNYLVVFTAFNDANPGGVSATVTVFVATQSIHYVSLAGTNPVSPYLSWDTAATNIQDAVDAATAAGALVLVSNGVYQTGERVTYDSQTNRLAIIRPVTVESVNGPAVTVIDGERVVRCVYLTNGTALTGFTLTNGATSGNGGGVFCESTNIVVLNCVLVTNSAASGGGAYGGTLNNCTLSDDSAVVDGGGACSGMLSDCVINHNSANAGGGARGATLNNCSLTGNSSAQAGGGADSSILNNCDLRSNWVGGISVKASIKGSKQAGPTPRMVLVNFGGGAENSTLNNCTLVGNQAYGDGFGGAGAGGGADSSTLNNCTVTDNSADFGGGAENSTLNNCTLTGNSAGNNFGGADSSTLNNCIVYYNTNGDYFNSSLNYCCTAQPPDNGIGNITNDPALVNPAGNDFHLQSNSPCINSGNNAFVTVTNDFDGHPRIKGDVVDIGAYEYQTPTSVISYAWLQQYGLPTDGIADYADTDGDGFNNWHEWQIGTSPTDPSSLLKLTAVTNDVSGITVTWQSASGIAYFIQRSTNLLTRPAFQTIATEIAGQADTTSYTDTEVTGNGPYFYRVGVNNSKSGQWVQWDPAAGGNGHWYMAVFISTGCTWSQASQLAQAAGGYLATITSAAENDFVFSLIDSPAFFRGIGDNGAGPAIGGYWEGGNWYWVTGEPWDYTSWAPNQPDEIGYETRLQYWSGSQGVPTPTWNNFPPDDPNMCGYIIECDTKPDTVP